MALLHESVDFKKLDVRLIERNVNRGVITQEELRKAQESLPDDSENAEWIDIHALAEDGESDSKGTSHS